MSRWRHEEDLRALPDALPPGPEELERVQRRLQLSLESRRRRAWLPALVLAAAALALIVGVGRQRDLALDSPAAWSDERLARGVALRFQGSGLATGSSASPVIRWEEGELALSVPPGRGLDLRVQTAEAEVLVVGTRFSVERDARGTAVHVHEGRVAVTCVDGAARLLTKEDHIYCPRSAAATLLLVRELQQEGALPAERLALLERALGRADADEAVRGELRYRMVDALEDLGRTREARALAELALSGPEGPRTRALRATAGRLAVAEGDCEAALPHLRALQGEPDPVALVLLADCLGSTDPGAAREALEAALRMPLSEAQRATVLDRLARLPGPG